MFESPFTLILTGATGSGKTQWLVKFLEHYKHLIEPTPSKIFYCYGEPNEKVLRLRKKEIDVFHGVPDEEMIKEKSKPLLLILDDLLLNLKSDFLDLLFTRGSHNWNVSVVFVTQSLYGKNIRIARQNTHYLVLMRNPSAQLQIRTTGSQLFPGKTNFFLESYEEATKKPFTYLIINMHPNARDELRLCTKIFPGEKTEYFIPM